MATSYTYKYVTPTGAGSANGTSWSNAWTLAQAVDNAGSTDCVLVEGGTYTITSDNDLATVSGMSLTVGGVIYVGMKSDRSDIARDWDDCPQIDCNGYRGFSNTGGDGATFYGMKVYDSDQYGLYMDWGINLIHMWFHNNTTYGARTGQQGLCYGSRFTSNGSYGYYCEYYIPFILCEFYDNTNDGCYTQSTCDFIGCYFNDNGGAGGARAGAYARAFNNTFYDEDATAGLSCNSANRGTIMRNHFVNNGIAVNGVVTSYNFLLDNNWNGNTTDYGNSLYYADPTGGYDFDPKFVAITNNNYQHRVDAAPDEIFTMAEGNHINNAFPIGGYLGPRREPGIKVRGGGGVR